MIGTFERGNGPEEARNIWVPDYLHLKKKKTKRRIGCKYLTPFSIPKTRLYILAKSLRASVLYSTTHFWEILRGLKTTYFEVYAPVIGLDKTFFYRADFFSP